MAYPVLSIANKILAYGAAANDEGELFSNMKLQKLLYYVQGFHIAVFNRPLFNEDIEAWMYGPVVPAVYEYYQENGNKGIMPNEKPITLEAEEESLYNLNKILNTIEKRKYSKIFLPENFYTEEEFEAYKAHVDMEYEIQDYDEYIQYKNFKLPKSPQGPKWDASFKDS